MDRQSTEMYQKNGHAFRHVWIYRQKYRYVDRHIDRHTLERQNNRQTCTQTFILINRQEYR